MRHLGAMGYIIETGEDEYRPTNFTKSLSVPIIGGGYYAMLVPICLCLFVFFLLHAVL